MFGTLGGPELFLILVVALIVFGPRKLPDIGKSVGRMMAEFRKASNDFKRTIEDEVEAEKLRDATRIDPPAWSTADASAVAPAALPPASTDESAYQALGEPAASGSEPAAAASDVAPAAAPATPAEPAPGDANEAPPADTVSRGEGSTESR